MLRLAPRFSASRRITRSAFLRRFLSMSSTADSLLVPIDPTSISVSQEVPVDVKTLWTSARTENAKPNTTRTFYEKDQIVSVVSLGTQLSKKTTDARNEALRAAVGTGIKSLLDAGAKHIGIAATENEHVAGMSSLHVLYSSDSDGNAAEGALLGAFDFTLKTSKDSKPPTVPISSFNTKGGNRLNWNTGSIYASSQNLAREVTTPVEGTHVRLLMPQLARRTSS